MTDNTRLFFCCFECETVELDELQVGFIECKPAAKAKICSQHTRLPSK